MPALGPWVFITQLCFITYASYDLLHVSATILKNKTKTSHTAFEASSKLGFGKQLTKGRDDSCDLLSSGGFGMCRGLGRTCTVTRGCDYPEF